MFTNSYYNAMNYSTGKLISLLDITMQLHWLHPAMTKQTIITAYENYSKMTKYTLKQYQNMTLTVHYINLTSLFTV